MFGTSITELCNNCRKKEFDFRDSGGGGQCEREKNFWKRKKINFQRKCAWELEKKKGKSNINAQYLPLKFPAETGYCKLHFIRLDNGQTERGNQAAMSPCPHPR